LPEQVQRRLPGGRVVLLGVLSVERVDHAPGHSRHDLTARQLLSQLDLQRVHGRDMMDHDADLSPIPGDPAAPLRVREGGRERGEGLSTLFEASGKSFTAQIHLNPLG
jgi:hypothetical protein